MPDISMCSNKNCPIRKECYRFMAVPKPFWQSYGGFKYEKGKCDAFLKIKISDIAICDK